MRPISEKAAELLFSRYMLQALGLRKAQLFAPSSWEERRVGYDQSIAGLSRFREINLQFKSPEVVEKWNRFTIRLSKSQHLTLLRLYRRRTAFYVAHTFTSLKQLNAEQMSPHLAAARDFLKNFICIDVRGLPECTRSVHYVLLESGSKPREPTFKVDGDSSRRADTQPVKKTHWFRGDALLDALASGTVGEEIDLVNRRTEDLTREAPGLASTDGDSEEVAPRDIGVYVRLLLGNTSDAGG